MVRAFNKASGSLETGVWVLDYQRNKLPVEI